MAINKQTLMDTPKSMKNLTLLVLAAGIGSRYGGIKQIDGFGPHGETIMDYSLFDAVRAGFTKVVFIVREEILDTVKEKFLTKLKGKVEVEFVIQSLDKLVAPEFTNPERVKPWGTGHAMLCARDVIKEPFVVINADDFYGKESFAAIADFFEKDNLGEHAMVGYTLKDFCPTRKCFQGMRERDAEGFLKSVVERTTIVKENGKIISKEQGGDRELSPDVPTSMNFWGFHPTIFDFARREFERFLNENHTNIKSEFYIPIIVNELVKQGAGKVQIISGSNNWFGVTYKEDKEVVSQKIKVLVAYGAYRKICGDDGLRFEV